MGNFTRKILRKVSAYDWEYLGAAVGLLGLIVVVWYFVFVRINHGDYVRTSSAVSATIADYNDLLTARDKAITAVDAPDEKSNDFQKTVDDYQKAEQKYQASFAEIATQKSLGNSDLKTSYNILSTKNDNFVQFINNQLATLPLVQGATANCQESSLEKLNVSDLSQIVDAYKTATKPCLDAMQKLASSNIKSVADRGKQAVDYLNSMQQLAEAMKTAYLADNRDVFKVKFDSFSKLITEFGVNTDVASLLDIDKTAIPTMELNQLAKVVGEHI
ncbi:MAG: hypothetical protein ABI397_00550 [Candidatus Saccharimonas sp.]